MSPHVPTVLHSPTTSSGLGCVDHFQLKLHANSPHPSTMATPSIVDKKRGRPLEEFSHARKKIASELMAFEFQSLSLSNGDGSVIQDGSPSSGSQLRRHPPVQQQSAQQQHQHQLDQNEAQFATVPPQDIQQHDRVQTKALQNPDMHNERLQQQQRGRAKSSPIAPARTILDHAVEILPEQRTDQSPDAPSSSSMLSAPCQDYNRLSLLHTHRNHTDQAAQPSIPSSISPFLLLSPPISSPSMTSTIMDVSMNMDEGVLDSSKASIQDVNLDGNNSSAVLSPSSSSSGTTVSSVKVLSLRQRKWNSVRKEWQDWQEVQATHTPDLPVPAVEYEYDTQMQANSSSDSPGFNGPGSGPNVEQGASEAWTARHGKAILHESASPVSHPHSGGLGRQHSFHEPVERSRIEYNGDQQSNTEQRGAVGARARSFSETNIYPHIQSQHQSQQQHQDPYSTMDVYQMPVPQRINHSLAQVETHHQQQQQPSHRSHSSQQAQRHYGHPARHHSDHIYPQHGDHWERNDDGETEHARYNLQPLAQPSRNRHNSLNSGATSHQHSWMALSMTSLDGTVNVPSDRFSRFAPSSSSGSSSSGSTSSATRLEELHSWNQQLLKSQNGYRESNGVQRHGYGRASPVQHYGGQHQHHQYQHHHGSVEDVSMGEEATRPMPSRSSSPVPCLSMAPTITRPLSISFSHLAGSNMLGNLSEHEHDDDMEL
ncbi:hypothetical protein BC939DRAFT_460538 [Gamsiella multidivaricata]|uniref:uncharacterized protein n=1 Tax=Gamsiella multidivaricata TaxID=101098 RepID=UPI00221EDF05|nr:uncharacterized protein BC939DRAFT_460538 [Gamsiella multidivaricata]KAI7819201.1 hypothetical protein BC939DRAFT_460538 [Gamsiella multidivaricata]